MRGWPRGQRRSVDRGACRLAIEPRKGGLFGAPTPLSWRKARRSGAQMRVPERPRVVGDPSMRVGSLYGNREISRLTAEQVAARIGKTEEVVADDARTREVRLPHSTCEAGEQGRDSDGGAGGGKGGGQGKHGTSAHTPDAEPGKRVPGVGPCTASRKAQEGGTVHCAPPPCWRRSPARGLLLAEAGCRTWCGRRHMAVVWRRPRGSPRRPPRPGPPGGVSGAAVTTALHNQAGRADAASRHRGAGGQDCPAGRCRGAERGLRGRLPRVLVWVSAGARPARCACTRWRPGSPARM